MNSVEFLDAVRSRRGLTSDRQLAKLLRINQGRVSLYRTGARKLDPEACIKVAHELELPAEYVLASVQAERAKRTEHRRLWQRLAKAAKELPLMCVVGLAAATSSPAPSHAEGASAPMYIMFNPRRWWIPLWSRRGRASSRPSRPERRHHVRRRAGRPSQIPARRA